MNQFISALGPDMDRFLQLKDSLGYSRCSYEYHLTNIDGYAASCFPQLTVMDKALVFGWCKVREGESKNYRRIRQYVIREFGKFQQGMGRDAYVLPTDLIERQQTFVPYLFTDDELQRLFQSVDSSSASKYSPNKPYVLPVLFRMMYCCALRPGEPLKLLTEDVNLEAGTIFIRESKRHKDRIVWMSEDLTRLCIHYDTYAGARTYFFTSPKGEPYTRMWMEEQFRRCCRKSNLHTGFQKPRPYDLRHTSCSRVILKWMEEGKDFNTLSPFLREHMGHSDFESTFYYIHLLPEHIVTNAGINCSRVNFLYPEVPDEET